MRWPGRCQAPISIRCGSPTIAAITSRVLLTYVSGTSAALQSIETSFQQDLNGDGSIGLCLHRLSPTVIEGFGSTSLTEGGSNYFLQSDMAGRRLTLSNARARLMWPVNLANLAAIGADWRGADGDRV